MDIVSENLLSCMKSTVIQTVLYNEMLKAALYNAQKMKWDIPVAHYRGDEILQGGHPVV